MIPLPFVAVIAGWMTTEVGRQPWVLYEHITVQDGLTPSLTGGMALFTLIGYVLVYAAVFTAGIYYMVQIVRQGIGAEAEPPQEQHPRPKRPLSVADRPLDESADER
jgi:cytochrome bd ubiquinol oxidase subunit I